MELSHRDQTESSAAGGFLPANTHHPLTFRHHTTLYLFTTLEEKMSSLCLGITVTGLEGDFEQQNKKTAYLPPVLCIVYLHLYPPLCCHARRPICGLCIGEAEFSPTVLKRDVHPTIPAPCTQSHHSALTPGCCLALSHWTAILHCF